MKLLSICVEDAGLAELNGKKIVTAITSNQRAVLLAFSDRTYIVFIGSARASYDDYCIDTLYASEKDIIKVLLQEDVGFTLEQLLKVKIITKKQYDAIQKEWLANDPDYQQYLELHQRYGAKDA